MILAEFVGGPADELTIERLVAYWAPEKWSVVLVFNDDHGEAGARDRVGAHVWADAEPDHRDWTYTDDRVTAHKYRLENVVRRDGMQVAEYRHVEAIRGVT